MSQINVALYRKRLFITVALLWMILFISSTGKLELIAGHWYFFLLGVVGAIVANSTGAGGGIIFIPFFTALGLAQNEALGTSILIQCFGMTAGAISWLTTSQIIRTNSHHINRLLFQLMVVCSAASIAGVLSGQYLLVLENTNVMVDMFRAFSILFGIVLLIIVFNSHKLKHTQFDLLHSDAFVLAATGFIGGLITAWISVGIGELVAVFLILRRYPVMIAICMGVVASAISVLTAAHHHISVLESVDWSIIQFAAPGAILGATFAYLLSQRLGPKRLKVFFSIWIIITAIFM